MRKLKKNLTNFTHLDTNVLRVKSDSEYLSYLTEITQQMSSPSASKNPKFEI